MGVFMKFKFSFVSFLFLFTFVSNAANCQIELESFYTGTDEVLVDGDLGEWFKEGGEELVSFLPLGKEDVVGGEGTYEGEEDIGVEFGLAHNEKHLFIAFKAKDQRFIRTEKPSTLEDHFELWISFQGRNTKSFGIGIFADPSKYNVPVKIRKIKSGSKKTLGEIQGARGASQGWESDYTVEVAIPWTSISKKKQKLKKLGAAAFMIDTDTGAHMVQKTVLGTAPLTALKKKSSLPKLVRSEQEASLDKFLEERGLDVDLMPKYSIEADVIGKAEVEKLFVVGSHLVAMGGIFGTSGNYAYTRLPAKNDDEVVDFLIKDLTGDKKGEIVLIFEEKNQSFERKWIEIYKVKTFDESITFSKIFVALLWVKRGEVYVENKYKFVKDKGKKRAILITAGKAKGVKNTPVSELPIEGENPMVLPGQKNVKYTFKKGVFRY